jgi:hypothetical protein
MRTSIVAVVLVLGTTARANDATELGKLVDGQVKCCGTNADIFTSDAVGVTTEYAADKASGIVPEPYLSSGGGIAQEEAHRAISFARDGKSAWISLELKIMLVADNGRVGAEFNYRLSEVAVKVANGWRIAAISLTKPVDDAAANRLAIAGKLDAPGPVDNGGEDDLRSVFEKLVSSGFDKPDAATKQLVVYGSAPGERTANGPAFAKAWNALWAKHLEVKGASAWLAPSNTTGWVIANVNLRKVKGKTAYTIPFRLFFVFDKDAAGAWQLVHAQFAVRDPNH